jgi:hypothetical protein
MMNKNPKVDQYMRDLDNPLKDIWEEIREIILGVDPKMEEDIKWKSPTFIYKGNLASFNPRAKKHANLMFHHGALIDDPDGVLEGDGKQARTFRAYSSKDLAGKKAGLEQVVQNWIKLKDQ